MGLRRGRHHPYPDGHYLRAQPPSDHVGNHRTAHHGAARRAAAAADVVLDAGVLDRIDEIVAPGTTVNPVDNSFNNPALTPSARRRSPLGRFVTPSGKCCVASR